MDQTTKTSTDAKPATRKRWFRFSISTLLLLSTIVALSIAHWTSSRDRLAMERKLEQIRADHDLLEISNPEKIHVLPLPSSFDHMGQVRVYLPEGENYLLKFDWHDVPREQEPHAKNLGRELTPGSYLIDYVIRSEPMQRSTRWVVYISAKSGGDEANIRYALPWDAPNWLEAESVGNGHYRMPLLKGEVGRGSSFHFWDRSDLETGQTAVIDNDDAVTIVQTGVMNDAALTGSLILDNLTTDDVFRIWIEKAPKTP